MVASIGAVVAPAQCVAYFERDDYYAKDDRNHRESSIWRGRGAEDLGLSGPVDPEVLRSVLEGVVPDGSGRRLGKRGKDGVIHHRPGRDLTFPARVRRDAEKNRIPAQPVAHEGANGGRALDIGYENMLITACRSYMFIRMKTHARE